LQKHLSDNGVQILIHYPIPPHKQQAYLFWNKLTFPITEQIHQEVLSLPMGPLMEQGEVDNIVQAINQYEPPCH
jgi:dTDP-4-amino-4,6-dideoxygalactose transaminase